MRLWTCAALLLLAGCDDFAALGTCENSPRCSAATVCSTTNPVFVEDPWFRNRGQIPTAVWVAPGGTVWVGTDTNSIYRGAVGSWTLEQSASAAGGPQSGVNTLWGPADAPVFAGGWGGQVEQRNPSTEQWDSLGFANSLTVFAFSGISATDSWAAASAGIFHLQNGEWDAGVPLSASASWQGAWAGSPDVWVVGVEDVTSIQRPVAWNVGTAGSTPEVMTFSGQLESAWGSSPADVWAVGQDTSSGGGPEAAFCHHTGGSWSCDHRSSATHAYGVWGRASDDVWASADGVIYHFDGNQMQPTQVAGADGGVPNFFRLWGNSTQVWAAGDTLVHCP